MEERKRERERNKRKKKVESREKSEKEEKNKTLSSVFSHLGPRVVSGRPVGAFDKHVDGLGRRALRDGGLFCIFFSKEEKGEKREKKKVRWRSSRRGRERLDRTARKKKKERGSCCSSPACIPPFFRNPSAPPRHELM